MKREITSTRIRLSSNRATDRRRNETSENVVQRLRRRIAESQSDGTVVRVEILQDHQANWFELRGIRTILLDASQTAAEQLGQLEDILVEISDAAHSSPSNPKSSVPRAA